MLLITKAKTVDITTHKFGTCLLKEFTKTPGHSLVYCFLPDCTNKNVHSRARVILSFIESRQLCN